MTNVEKDRAAQLEKLLNRSLGDGVELGLFLSKSILLANGAALLACFSALANGHVCTPSAFAPLIWSFTIGLSLGFAGLVSSYYSGLYVISNLAKQRLLVASLLDTTLSPEDKQQARNDVKVLERYFAKFGKTMPRINQALYGASALVFIFGIVSPMITPCILNSLCPPAPH